MRVYLASPLGFAESTRDYLGRVVRELRADGHDVLDPWDSAPELAIDEAQELPFGPEGLERLRRANIAIGARNEAFIRSCDAVVAILDGPDVDSGTASEVGFAYATGKVVLGLRTDVRRAGENEAVKVNLQVQYWIEASRGAVLGSLDDVLSRLR
jgi:nucleoside 2-deoxyribosyltransferase